MTNYEIIRAWKDESYRASLTDTERSLLPESPAGALELDDAVLANAVGGDMTGNTICQGTCGFLSYGCCHAPQ